MEDWQLGFRQALPLEIKIRMTLNRIKSFYDELNGEIYVSFSGGKDSTVLLYLTRLLYPKVPAMFANTGLEYPEVLDFIRQIENVIWMKPKLTFRQVIDKYGYPVVSKEQSQYISDARTTHSEKFLKKRMGGESGSESYAISKKWRFLIKAPFNVSHQCCKYLKKQPSEIFENKTGLSPIVGTMACDSTLRKNSYIRRGGCNTFSEKRNLSTPMMFWTEEDVWQFIKENNMPYSKIYDLGYRNTGCTFCGYGLHLEPRPNKFDLMRKTHPKMFKYCMEEMGLYEVLKYTYGQDYLEKEENILDW